MKKKDIDYLFVKNNFKMKRRKIIIIKKSDGHIEFNNRKRNFKMKKRKIISKRNDKRVEFNPRKLFDDNHDYENEKSIILNMNNLSFHKKFKSRIPKLNNSSIDHLLRYYATDFIYRILYHTSQIMYIANRASRGEKVIDPKLSDDVNDKQYIFFRDFGKILKKSMKFPKRYERSIENEQVERLSNKLEQHLRNTKTTFTFRFLVMRSISIDNSLFEFVKKMIPKKKHIVLKLLLHTIFTNDHSLGIESTFKDNNSFNAIFDFCTIFGMKYMTGYGILHFRNGNQEILQERKE